MILQAWKTSFWKFCWRFSGGVVKTASYIFIGISWVKTYFLDKLCLSIVFPDIEQNLSGHFWRIYKNWLLRDHRKILTKKIWTFFSLSDIEIKFFVQSSKNLCQGCQDCILAFSGSLGTISGHIFSIVLRFFSFFWTQIKNSRPFVQNRLTRALRIYSS